MATNIRSHRELRVYQAAMAAQKEVFVLSLRFPRHELYRLTDQVRRASRAVAPAIGEAWRKRRYRKLWISKLTDAEQEAAETQIWLETARDCGYLDEQECGQRIETYEKIIAQLTRMATQPDKWVTRPPRNVTHSSARPLGRHGRAKTLDVGQSIPLLFCRPRQNRLNNENR